MAYTPIARAIQSHRKPFQLANANKLTQTLMPSPSFRGMSKVRTLQTEIPCVTIVRFRLGVSLCDGVSEFIPVFPGLQTGSSSLSPACQVSLDVLGETSSLPAFYPFCYSSIAIVCFHGARFPPCGVPVSVWMNLPSSITPDFRKRAISRSRLGSFIRCRRNPIIHL